AAGGAAGPVEDVRQAVDTGEFGAQDRGFDVVLQEHGDELVGVGLEEVDHPLQVHPEGDGSADQRAAVVAEDGAVRRLVDVQHEPPYAVGELAFDAVPLIGEEVGEGRRETAVDAVGVGVVRGEEGDLVEGAAVRGRHGAGDRVDRGEVPGGEVVRAVADDELRGVGAAGRFGAQGEAAVGAGHGQGEAVVAGRGDLPGGVLAAAADGAGLVAGAAEAAAGAVGVLQQVGAPVGAQVPLLAVLVAARAVLLDGSGAVGRVEAGDGALDVVRAGWRGRRGAGGGPGRHDRRGERGGRGGGGEQGVAGAHVECPFVRGVAARESTPCGQVHDTTPHGAASGVRQQYRLPPGETPRIWVN